VRIQWFKCACIFLQQRKRKRRSTTRATTSFVSKSIHQCFIIIFDYLVFEGVVLLSVGHGAALEPAVKHFVDALQVSRLSLDHNVVDTLTVKVLHTHAYDDKYDGDKYEGLLLLGILLLFLFLEMIEPTILH